MHIKAHLRIPQIIDQRIIIKSNKFRDIDFHIRVLLFIRFSLEFNINCLYFGKIFCKI